MSYISEPFIVLPMQTSNVVFRKKKWWITMWA